MPDPAQLQSSPTGQPSAPPMGQSPATQPTANKGYQAAGLQKLGVVVKQMGEILPLLGVTSDEGMALLDAMRKLGKFVPSGSVSPSAEKNQLQGAMERNAQNNQQMAALKASQGQGAPGGMPGGGGPQVPKAA